MLVAPSGAGKTTIAKRLLSELDVLSFSTSATTRPPRENETHGKDYFFLSPDQFQEHIDNGDFVEWEEFYGGKRYGTLKREVENKLKNGYFILLDLEVKGAMNVKEQFGNACLTIFIKPPSLQVLRERLIGRGSESEETLQRRLARAEYELSLENKFDLVILNDVLEQAFDDARSAVLDEIDKTNQS